MISKEHAARIAQEVMVRERHPDDSKLVIDTQNIEHLKGYWVIPYNSPEYISTRNEMDVMLDCWPVLVNSESGVARMSTIDDLEFLEGYPTE
ncbi:YrhB domain-containing protein [Streptomyces sp. NPDC093085]|uniref:YrhB domain-containing protein n=1 Tax=Streptomyces sp. NPDC093085 TaxID=3155068 RepID=UPI003430BDCD